MKLYYSPASPFVRKVHVCALELGLDDQIEKLPSAAHPVNQDPSIVALNPTGRVPTLLTNAGETLFDSRVICEYLDALDGHQRLFPAPGPARWRALREQALADGLLESALAIRYETLVRPEAKHWQPWIEGHQAKLHASLTTIEVAAHTIGERFDIGAIALACTLGYLDFRFGALDWRGDCPAASEWFAEVEKRYSMAESMPWDPAAKK